MLHYIKKKKTHLWIRIKPNLVLREGLWGRGREGWQGPGWQDSWNLLDYMVEEWPHVCIFRFHCSSWNGVEWHACSVVSVTLWTVARQAPLSMEFPRQGYSSGLPLPSPGDCSNPGVEPVFSASPALAGDSLVLSHQNLPISTLLRWGGKKEYYLSVLSKSWVNYLKLA